MNSNSNSKHLLGLAHLSVQARQRMEATSRTEGRDAYGGGEEEEEEEGPMLSDAELDRMLLDWEPEGGEGEGEEGQQEVLLEEFMSAAEGIAAAGPVGGKTGGMVRAESTLVSDKVEGRLAGSVTAAEGSAEGRVLEHLLAPKAAPSPAEQRTAHRQRSTAVPPAFSSEAPSSRPSGGGAELEDGDGDDDLMGFENLLDDVLPASSGPLSPPPSTSAYDQQQGSSTQGGGFGRASAFPLESGVTTASASASAAGSVLAQIQAALQAGASPEELKSLIDQACAATGTQQQQQQQQQGDSASTKTPPAAASKPRAPPPPRAAGPSRPPPVPPSDDPLLQLRPEIRRQLEGKEGR